MRVVEGGIGDYDALGCYHYRAGRPATWVRVLVARVGDRGERVGVLVVSMPALNASWRSVLMPRLLAGAACARERALRVNAGLRTISRVVVEPRWRGRGVATGLVRAYLGDPLTRYTEALAVMGRCCPVFARAGMRGCGVPPSRADVRLASALRRAGVGVRGLVVGSERARLIGEGLMPEGALRVWAGASRGTRRFAGGPVDVLARLAGARLLARPVAYGYERCGSEREGVC